MRLKCFLHQFVGSTIMSFPKFLLGSGLVWPSYALLILQSPLSPLPAPVSLMEEALIGSLPLVSSIVMSPFGGVIVDKIGRRYSGILTNIIITISWIFIGVGESVPMLLVGRFIFGVSGGLLMQVAWSFTAEISSDAVRGFMSSLPSVMYALGALVSILLGWVTSYRSTVWINVALAAANAFTMWVLPESPVYLAMVGRDEEALKSLSFYRALTSQDKAVMEEMSQIKRNQADKQKFNSVVLVASEEPAVHDHEKQNLSDPEFVPAAKITAMQYFRISTAARWSFFVVAALMTQSILTGVIAVQVYGGPLFVKATPSLSPDLCAVLLASILLIGSICGAVFTDLFGRRILLMSAAAINGICMLALGTLVRWSWGPQWLVPFFILVFSFIFNLGGGMIPYVLLAEVFVPEVKGFAQSIIMLWLYIVNFILLLAFVPAVELVGLDAVFFVFSVCAVSTTILTYYLLPETKGLSPYAIEEAFGERIREGRRWAAPKRQ